MKRGTYPQILMKSKESLESTLKTYSSKLEYLEEMDKFLDAYNQPILNQDDIKGLNSPNTCNEIEAVIKILPTKKSS
jgi:hypothetical protein